MPEHNDKVLQGTTIVSVRKGNTVVIAGDGQVTLGSQVIKATAKKVRSLCNGDVIVGFAGSASDSFALLQKLEENLDKYPRQLTRACVELAKDFRSDKARKLEAMLLVADSTVSFTITGTGDILESENNIMSIGSGGTFALAAARALFENTDYDAEKIALTALKIAGDLCIYTNGNVTLEKIVSDK